MKMEFNAAPIDILIAHPVDDAYLIDSVGDDAEHVVDDVHDAVLYGDVRNEDLRPYGSTTELRVALVHLGHGVY